MTIIDQTGIETLVIQFIFRLQFIKKPLDNTVCCHVKLIIQSSYKGSCLLLFIYFWSIPRTWCLFRNIKAKSARYLRTEFCQTRSKGYIIFIVGLFALNGTFIFITIGRRFFLCSFIIESSSIRCFTIRRKYYISIFRWLLVIH